MNAMACGTLTINTQVQAPTNASQTELSRDKLVYPSSSPTSERGRNGKSTCSFISTQRATTVKEEHWSPSSPLMTPLPSDSASSRVSCQRPCEASWSTALGTTSSLHRSLSEPAPGTGVPGSLDFDKFLDSARQLHADRQRLEDDNCRLRREMRRLASEMEKVRNKSQQALARVDLLESEKTRLVEKSAFQEARARKALIELDRMLLAYRNRPSMLGATKPLPCEFPQPVDNGPKLIIFGTPSSSTPKESVAGSSLTDPARRPAKRHSDSDLYESSKRQCVERELMPPPVERSKVDLFGAWLQDQERRGFTYLRHRHDKDSAYPSSSPPALPKNLVLRIAPHDSSSPSSDCSGELRGNQWEYVIFPSPPLSSPERSSSAGSSGPPLGISYLTRQRFGARTPPRILPFESRQRGRQIRRRIPPTPPMTNSSSSAASSTVRPASVSTSERPIFVPFEKLKTLHGMLSQSPDGKTHFCKPCASANIVKSFTHEDKHRRAFEMMYHMIMYHPPTVFNTMGLSAAHTTQAREMMEQGRWPWQSDSEQSNTLFS